MIAFYFEEFRNAWAAQAMLASLVVLKQSQHSPTMQHIHSQLVGLQKYFDTDKNNRREVAVRLSKKVSHRCFYLQKFKRECFHSRKVASPLYLKIWHKTIRHLRCSTEQGLSRGNFYFLSSLTVVT